MSFPSLALPLRPLLARQALRLGLVVASASLASAAPQFSEEQLQASADHAARVLADRGIPLASAQEIDRLRTEIQLVLTEFFDIEAVHGVRDPRGNVIQRPGDPGPSLSTVPGLMDLVGRMSDAELTLAQELLPSFQELHRVTRQLRQAAVTEGLLPVSAGGSALRNLVPGAMARGGAGLPTAAYGCAAGRPTFAFTATALATVQTARGIQQGASRACDLVAFGFNGALVCLISDGIALVAEGVWAGVELCTGDADSAEINANYLRNGVLATKADAILSAVTGLQSSVSNAPVLSAISALQVLVSGTTVAVDAARTEILTAVDENESNIVSAINAATLATTSRVTATEGTILTELNEGEGTVLAAIGAGAATTATQVADAQTAIIAAVQYQGAGTLVPRLESIEDVLNESVARRHLRLQAITLVPQSQYLIVATDIGVGYVDVTLDPVQGWGSSFEDVAGASLVHMSTGVYRLVLPAGSAFPAYRIKATRELPPLGPDGDVLGFLYFHPDALISGGQ